MSSGNISNGAILKRGLPKSSSGTKIYGIPGNTFLAQSTTTPNINDLRYRLIYVEYPITITDYAFEVTSAPASDAQMRIGIYSADKDCQPVGAPIYDSGNIPVATGFTGVKSASNLSIHLTKGVYLVATNIDVAMTVRSYTSPSASIGGSLGTSALNTSFLVSNAYGAMATPGVPWTTRSGGTGGQINFVLFKWTE